MWFYVVRVVYLVVERNGGRLLKCILIIYVLLKGLVLIRLG